MNVIVLLAVIALIVYGAGYRKGRAKGAGENVARAVARIIEKR
ncbi:hypothetical protein [Streptomyces sp. NPDC005784]